MKTITTTVLTALTALAQLAFALPAFAYRDFDGTGGMAMLRQEIRLSEVKIEGALVCENANQNTNKNITTPCTLMIKNTRNGQMFNLTDAQEAYRMYTNGQKNVAIEGMITQSDTIRISRITAL